MIQDHEGYIWFATDQGVCRFDGTQIERFPLDKSMRIDPVIFGFSVDQSRRLWFRSFSGNIYYFDQDTIRPYAFNKILSSQTNGSILGSMVWKNNNTLLAGSFINGKIFSIDSIGNSTDIILPPSTLTILNQDNGSIIGYNGKTTEIKSVVIDGISFPILSLDTVKQQSIINHVKWKGFQFFSINKSIFQFDGKKIEEIKFQEPIINLSKDRSNNLWVGFFNGGVKRFKNPRLDHGYEFEPLAGKSVTTVLEDDEGGLWFSTLDKGVFYFPDLEIELNPFEKETKISCVDSSREFICVGDYSGCVTCWNKEGKLLWKKVFDSPLLAVFIDRHNNVWASTTNRTSVVSSDQKVSHINSISNIKDFCEDELGNIWGVNQNGLHRFNKSLKLEYSLSTHTWVRTLLIDDKTIFVGMLMGAGKIDIRPDNSSILPIPTLADYKIEKIRKWKQKRYLAATRGDGLIYFKNDSIHVFGTKEGFISDHILGLHIDNHLAWLATDQGIIKLNLEQLDKGVLNYSWLTASEGLIRDRNEIIGKTDSLVWTFYEDGWLKIPESKIKYPLKDALIRVRRILINEKQIAFLPPALSYNQNNLSFDISKQLFKSKKTRIRYRINQTSAWIPLEGNSIRLASLSPSEYELEIQATSDLVKWKSIYLFRFAIEPPWWRSWTFRILLFFILAGLIVTYFRLRIQTMRLKESALKSYISGIEKERSRIAGELHDDVGSRLSFLMRLLQTNSGEIVKASEQLEQLIKDVRHLSHDLAPPMTHLSGLIVLLEKLISDYRKTKALDIKLQVHNFTECLNSEQIQQVYRIVQEALNNIINHAQATRVDVQVFGYSEDMNITIEDNGIGFEPRTQTGLGLTQMKLRTETLNGRIEINSHPGKGTCILLQIPIK